MLDRTQSVIDERFTDTKEHKLAMTLHALSSAAGCLHEMSLDPEYRDLMIDEAGQLSSIALAVNLVWSRVQARSAAR